MSVHDEETYPWLVQEKRLIEQAVGAGRLVSEVYRRFGHVEDKAVPFFDEAHRFTLAQTKTIA